MSGETTDTVTVMARTMSALGRLTTRSRMRRELGGQSAKLSPTDMWLVDRVSEFGPARMSELATWQSVDRSTMTTQVGKLEKLGLVQRAPDPQDRRAIVVSVTEAGRQLHKESRAAACAAFDSMLADWSDAERSRLTESLTHLVDSLEKHLSTKSEDHSTER
ncbi:MarR family transcriptional regulator [Kocuria carniphila]|uniref:MarR family winged helix-turn-helix transcriptional regulator n=1 Tax=Kocuria carniphila TaxID=262208 RepID=UPI0028EFAB3F|nr:MarR family transcriptional regulator [Kocuria carniphila]